ncbi:MAG: class II aldolase/adducin family protein [Gammaproteobacteria bacterium]
MSQKLERELVVKIAKKLTAGRTGNLSARVENGFLITPTGIPNESLSSEQIVFIDGDGKCSEDQLKPSSEWRFHFDLYKKRSDVEAIVHTHSTYATALACLQKDIPPFHYMLAEAGGDSIRCAQYATFGTQALSDNILDAIKDRKACLMANHGMLAVGDNVKQAFDMAIQVEELAKQYVLTLQIGGPVILSKQEMAINIEKFKEYGKQNEPKKEQE